ncbi:MAG: hypothetical protein ACM3ZC_16840 [Bacteroidota bacterium]
MGRHWIPRLLATVVLLLMWSTAAGAAIVIDPGYQTGDLGLQLTVDYYPPDESLWVQGVWALNDRLGVEFTAGLDPEGYAVEAGLLQIVGPFWLEYGAAIARGDYELHLGSEFRLDAKLSPLVSGDLYWDGEILDGFAVVGMGWRPWEDSLIVLGVNLHGWKVMEQDLLFLEGAFPYLFASVRREYDRLTLRGKMRVLFSNRLHPDLNGALSITYTPFAWGGFGGNVSIAGGQGADLAMTYGLNLTVQL